MNETPVKPVRGVKKDNVPEWLKESARAYYDAVSNPLMSGVLSYLRQVNPEYFLHLTPYKRTRMEGYLKKIGFNIISKKTGLLVRASSTDKWRPPKEYDIPCKRVISDELGGSRVCTGMMRVELAPSSSTDKYQARCNICGGWISTPVHPAHPVVRDV